RHRLCRPRPSFPTRRSSDLKAAGVTGLSGTSGITYNASYLALDAAIAGHGVVLATSTIAAADIAAGRLVRLFSLALPDLFAYYVDRKSTRLNSSHRTISYAV